MTGKWHGLVIDTPDPRGLATFYQELLGFDRVQDTDHWVVIPYKWEAPDADDRIAHALPVESMLVGELPSGRLTDTELGDPEGTGHGQTLGRIKRPGSQPEGGQADEQDRHRLAAPPAHSPHLGAARGLDRPGHPRMDDSADRPGLAFQLAPDLEPPDWPDAGPPQQMHIDIAVDDIEQAEEQVLSLGAMRLPGGGATFRVYSDPSGHPFCLCF